MWDIRKRKRAVRILAFVQSLSCFDSFIDMSHSSFILMHLAVEQLQPEPLGGKKKSLCNLRGFVGFFFHAYWRSDRRGEQLGFGVFRVRGWLNVGNVALNVTIMIYTCKICGYEILNLISYAACRALKRRSYESGECKFVMDLLSLNRSWVILSYLFAKSSSQMMTYRWKKCTVQRSDVNSLEFQGLPLKF